MRIVAASDPDVLAIDPVVQDRLVMCQMIDDAIEYRRWRSALPCPACGPGDDDGDRCADHAQDQVVIRAYEARYEEAFSAAVAVLNPADVRQVIADDCLDRTAALHGVTVLGQLRALAADGPVLMNLEGRDVIIEIDGDRIAESPLEPPRTPLDSE